MQSCLTARNAFFFARGYDNTTVNDIIHEAGLSKGAFYHYFDSKAALLEALAVRMARDGVTELQAALDDPQLDAISRLNALFAGSRRYNIEYAPQIRKTFEVIFRPENIVLFHRMDQAVTAVVTPALAEILRKGAEQGEFRCSRPDCLRRDAITVSAEPGNDDERRVTTGKSWQC